MSKRACLALALIVLPAFIMNISGGVLPMTAAEVGLMLRSGYSSDAVTQEISTRHFVGGLDETAEANLRKSGASDELINEIKQGTFSLSQTDTAKAEEQMNALSQRRKADLAAQQFAQRQAAARAAKNPGPAAATPKMDKEATMKFLQGALVHYHGGGVVPADADALVGKKFVLYYCSAYWSAPCRKFTSQLVDYYRKTTDPHPEVEIVFFSLDRSAQEMANYMRDMSMPWLAVDYDKRGDHALISKVAGDAIPALFLVDGAGNVLSQSSVAGKDIGTGKVLADLDAILSGDRSRLARTGME